MALRDFARLAVLGWFVAGLAACTPAANPPDLSARGTGLAQTAAAVLTGTARRTVTPQTPTPVPSETLQPSATPPASPTQRASPTRPAPTPTPPRATATPSPAATACAPDDSEFVRDITVPDGTHFAPGTTFAKTWLLRNSSLCPWSEAYTIRHVAGEPMGELAVHLPAGVPPGATIEISVQLAAPAKPGTYVSGYQLHSPAGEAFGARPFVEIVVP